MTSRFSREYGAKLAKAQDERRRLAIDTAYERRPDNFEFNPLGLRTNKFGNERCGKYDSKREAKRAAELKMLEEGGAIRRLREKVQYLLIPAQYIADKLIERACTYTADFVYEEPSIHILPNGKSVTSDTWRTVVEDTKGYPNDRWPIKRKLMLFVHGIRVREV